MGSYWTETFMLSMELQKRIWKNFTENASVQLVSKNAS